MGIGEEVGRGIGKKGTGLFSCEPVQFPLGGIDREMRLRTSLRKKRIYFLQIDRFRHSMGSNRDPLTLEPSLP